jgi:hypothetical protein
MSIEQLLFFLLLVAIPLLQRLIRAMRARTDASLGDRLPGPERETISGRRSPVSVPDVGTTAGPPPLPPALPKAIPYAAPEHIRASEREPRLRVPTPVPATSRRTGHSERPLALRRVVAAGDLRRAIILMAILGPCRALEPKDASQLGEAG